VLVLPSGALADRYGRKRILLIGLTIFTLASFACGAAPNVTLLNTARALQGVGGALQLSAALAILSPRIPRPGAGTRVRILGFRDRHCHRAGARPGREHRGLDWGLTWIFPAVSCRASGQRKAFGVSQDSILEELYLVHDVGYSTKDFKRSLDDRLGIEPGMFDRYPLERGIMRRPGRSS